MHCWRLLPAKTGCERSDIVTHDRPGFIDPDVAFATFPRDVYHPIRWQVSRCDPSGIRPVFKGNCIPERFLSRLTTTLQPSDLLRRLAMVDSSKYIDATGRHLTTVALNTYSNTDVTVYPQVAQLNEQNVTQEDHYAVVPIRWQEKVTYDLSCVSTLASRRDTADSGPALHYTTPGYSAEATLHTTASFCLIPGQSFPPTHGEMVETKWQKAVSVSHDGDVTLPSYVDVMAEHINANLERSSSPMPSLETAYDNDAEGSETGSIMDSGYVSDATDEDMPELVEIAEPIV